MAKSPGIIKQTERQAKAMDNAELGRSLHELLDHIEEWDERSGDWDCNCGGEMNGESDNVHAHNARCPYRLYFELNARLQEAERRLTAQPVVRHRSTEITAVRTRAQAWRSKEACPSCGAHTMAWGPTVGLWACTTCMKSFTPGELWASTD